MVLNPNRKQQSRLPRRSAVQATLVTKRASLLSSLDVAKVLPEYQNADPSKWKIKKQTFNGRVAGNFNKEEVDGKLIDDGIEMFQKNPSKYIAIMYRPSDRNFPKKEQGFALIHRSGTTQFYPMEGSDKGEYILETQQYQRLPPLKGNNLPPLLRDKYTDLMTHNGKKLHTKKNKPIMPGRGMGVLDQPNMKLIGDIDPSDVKQGIIADCWLLSGISTLAEYDGAIRRMFRKTKNFDKMPFADRPNLYTVTLWDLKEWKEVDIVIDERLCSKTDAWNRNGENKLLGAKPSVDGELWVPYLEKAAAIHCGGWDAVSYGANCNHAWAVLAGVKEQCVILRKGDEKSDWACYAPYDPKLKKWAKHDSNPKKGNGNIWWVPWPEPGVSRFDDFEDFTDWNESNDKQLFDRMCGWDDENFLMACSSKGLSDHNKTDGIIDSHAYGIVDCRDNVAGTGLDLIQLRNPWGTAGGELEKGLFVTDKGKGWKKYPHLKKELGFVENDERIGVFWLTREEFFKYFDKIYLSARDMSEFMGYKPRPQQRPIEEADAESRKRKAENENGKENAQAQATSPKPSPKKPKPKGFAKIVKNVPQRPKNTGFAKMVPGTKNKQLPPTMEEPASKKEIEEMEAKIEKYGKEVAEKESALNSLQKELDIVKTKSANMQAKTSKMAEVQKELESRYQQQKRKVEQLENQNKSLKTNDGRLSSLQEELEKAKKSIRTLEQSKKDTLRNLEVKDGRIGSLRDELLEAKQTIESFGRKVGASNDRDRVKFNQVTKELKEKQAEVLSQATKLEKITSMENENRKKLREKENRINSLVNQLQQAKTEARSQGQNNERSLDRLRANDDQAASLSFQLQEAKQTIQSLEQRNRGNRDTEHIRLRKQLEAKQAEVDKQKAQLQQEKDNAIENRKKLKLKAEESASLRDELQRAKKDLDTLEHDKAEKRDRGSIQSKELQEKLNVTKIEFNVQASKLQQAKEKAKQLEEELRMEQMQNQRLSQRQRNSQVATSPEAAAMLREKDERLDFMEEKLKRLHSQQQVSSNRFEAELKQKDSQLQDLDKKLKELRHENEEIYHKQRRVSSADKKRIQELEDKLQEQRRLAESSKGDVEILKASLDDKQQLVARQADTANKKIVADLTNELEETKQKLRDMRKKQKENVSAEKSGILELETELGKQTNRSESLLRAVELHAEELKNKEKMIGSLKSELKEQRREPTSPDENASRAANVTAELDETNERLRTQLSTKKDSAKNIDTLRHQIDLKDGGAKRSSTKRGTKSGHDLADLIAELEATKKTLKTEVSANNESARTIRALEERLGMKSLVPDENGHNKADVGRYSTPLDVAKYGNSNYDVGRYSKPGGSDMVNGRDDDVGRRNHIDADSSMDRRRSDLGRHPNSSAQGRDRGSKQNESSNNGREMRRSETGRYSKSPTAFRDGTRASDLGRYTFDSNGQFETSNRGYDDSINDYLDGLAEKVRAAKSQLEATQRKVNASVGRHLPSSY